MISEVLQSPGSWEVTLVNSPDNLWHQLRKFGHIVVTSQRVDPNLLDDAGMLAAARYVGPLLRRERPTSSEFKLTGQGMVWWLGTQEMGDIIEVEVSLSASTLDNAITQLLPAAITKGTITEPPSATYTGVHQWETPLEAIRTVCASLGVEFRVNNDGTLDAGPKENLFTITTPKVVVTSLPGKDTVYKAVQSEALSISFDASEYASRVVVTATDSENVETIVGYVDRAPAPTEVDIHGNTIVRTFRASVSGEPVSVSTYVLSVLNDRAEVAEINIDTTFRDIAEGEFNVGDGFWAFEPPSFFDIDNEITFRGQHINPRLLRLLGASWGIHSKMGVYFRTPDVTPTYIDLNAWVNWEDETATGSVS